MALLETPAVDTNFIAPDFALVNIDDTTVSLQDAMGENGLVVAFICNHCPYVKAIITRFVKTAKALQEAGIGVIAIMPNDTVNYPADSFDNMKNFASQHNFGFPYVLDETQAVAKAYDAVCTPDIYGFDASGVLQYRGRLDSAGPHDADADTVPELLDAMLAVAKGEASTAPQKPSMGCSIKWV